MSEGTALRRLKKLARFSLRGMIVLVLVIGGGLGWLVSKRPHSTRGRDSRHERRRLGDV